MKVLITGSAGRVGRAIYIKLMRHYDVVGVDNTPCSTADYVGDIRDSGLINKALEGVEVIVHTAALHAPHVGLASDDDFQRINVEATERLALQGIQRGVKHFVFTSTTALYGYASTPSGTAGWVDEQVTPQPKTIYHKSKVLAESKLNDISNVFGLSVTVLQMSRCFPEPANLMAVYRLTRGVDARDVASAHVCAIEQRLSGYRRFIISGATPFQPTDTKRLYDDAALLLNDKCPDVCAEFERRGWNLPSSLDRIYDSSSAQHHLSWWPMHGFDSVLEMLDSETAEVLPASRG